LNPTWIKNEDGSLRCTVCGAPSFVPGIGSCECPPAGSLDADAPGPGSFRAESRALSDSSATGLPAGGLSYWEAALARVEGDLDGIADETRLLDADLKQVAADLRLVAKDLDRDRHDAVALKTGGDSFMAERDSLRLRKEIALAQKDALKEQRATIVARKDLLASAKSTKEKQAVQIRAGYEMAKAREQEKWVVRQERTAKALGLIRAGRHDEALLELEGAAN